MPGDAEHEHTALTVPHISALHLQIVYHGDVANCNQQWSTARAASFVPRRRTRCTEQDHRWTQASTATHCVLSATFTQTKKQLSQMNSSFDSNTLCSLCNVHTNQTTVITDELKLRQQHTVFSLQRSHKPNNSYHRWTQASTATHCVLSATFTQTEQQFIFWKKTKLFEIFQLAASQRL